jgi:hypothetical protein
VIEVVCRGHRGGNSRKEVEHPLSKHVGRVAHVARVHVTSCCCAGARTRGRRGIRGRRLDCMTAHRIVLCLGLAHARNTHACMTRDTHATTHSKYCSIPAPGCSHASLLWRIYRGLPRFEGQDAFCIEKEADPPRGARRA